MFAQVLTPNVKHDGKKKQTKKTHDKSPCCLSSAALRRQAWLMSQKLFSGNVTVTALRQGKSLEDILTWFSPCSIQKTVSCISSVQADREREKQNTRVSLRTRSSWLRSKGKALKSDVTLSNANRSSGLRSLVLLGKSTDVPVRSPGNLADKLQGLAENHFLKFLCALRLRLAELYHVTFRQPIGTRKVATFLKGQSSPYTFFSPVFVPLLRNW